MNIYLLCCGKHWLIQWENTGRASSAMSSARSQSAVCLCLYVYLLPLRHLPHTVCIWQWSGWQCECLHLSKSFVSLMHVLMHTHTHTHTVRLTYTQILANSSLFCLKLTLHAVMISSVVCAVIWSVFSFVDLINSLLLFLICAFLGYAIVFCLLLL